MCRYVISHVFIFLKGLCWLTYPLYHAGTYPRGAGNLLLYFGDELELIWAEAEGSCLANCAVTITHVIILVGEDCLELFLHGLDAAGEPSDTVIKVVDIFLFKAGGRVIFGLHHLG